MSKLWYGNNAELNVSANHSKAKGLWSLVVFFHNASVPWCLHMSSFLLLISALIKFYDSMITIKGHTLSRISRSSARSGIWKLKLHRCPCYSIIKSLLTQIHALLWHVCEIVCRQMVCPGRVWGAGCRLSLLLLFFPHTCTLVSYMLLKQYIQSMQRFSSLSHILVEWSFSTAHNCVFLYKVM